MFRNGKKNNCIRSFENISIPEGKDEATRAVIQVKIDETKAMYLESPDIWETWIAIGNLKTVLEDYEGAVEAFRQSIILQNNNIFTAVDKNKRE